MVSSFDEVLSGVVLIVRFGPLVVAVSELQSRRLREGKLPPLKQGGSMWSIRISLVFKSAVI
jgi:hypothetical protein